jgi:hypothetical protein
LVQERFLILDDFNGNWFLISVVVSFHNLNMENNTLKQTEQLSVNIDRKTKQ